ncbi:hypothetical protein [Staphylococcus gallinarum]|uniref:hypothetical protein n=1 Tax=Staphylococcus gallinarum TaxID=1293 RepID=UPI0030EB8831
MHNLHDEFNRSHEQTYYIDFLIEDNLYKVKSYDLFLITNKDVYYYKLVEYVKAFNSPYDLDYIKYNYDIAYKSVLQNYKFKTKKGALRQIINNHEYLFNVHHDNLSKYSDFEYIFKNYVQIEKQVILISKFLDLEIGKIHQTFYKYNIHLMDEINEIIKDKYNVTVSYEHYENKTVCNYINN